MRLARRWGFPDTDELLEILTPQQFDEWAAFSQIEPDTLERLHAQLSAIGGAVLYELQVVVWYLSNFVADEATRQELRPPQIPKPEALDPLDPCRQKRRPTRKATEESSGEFVSASAAAMLLKGAVGG